MKYVSLFENFRDYQAPPKKIVYRASKFNTGNWYAFSKDDAIGYMNYGDKIYKKNIGNLLFLDKNEIEEGGSLYDEIIQKFPQLFKHNKEQYWTEYTIDVSDGEYYQTLKPYLILKGYSGIFTGKKLSIDYEVYVF